MHIVLWRYRARPGSEAEFESAYGDSGLWAAFFRTDAGYLGTDLLRATDGRYLTMDRWVSAGAHEEFLRSHAQAYAELDARCSALTAEETPLGSVEA
jgi:heme-degrading monooxygenase HmoA